MDQQCMSTMYDVLALGIEASKKARTIDDVNECINGIFGFFYRYINNPCFSEIDKSKSELFCNAIDFMLEYFPDLTYKQTTSSPTINRKIYNGMVRELINIYIYIPQAKRIQMKMFKDAKEYVDKRDNKRLKTK